MDYKKHYDLLIETRRLRKLDNIYYERHHIIPRSMCGDNSENNLIYLTPREHFISHWLLWRIYKNKEMAFAFFCLCKMSKHKNKVSSRIYEEAKISRRPFIVETNKRIHTGKKISTKQIEETSIRFKGVSKTSEHRKKISDSNKGKKKSTDHKKKISESLAGFDWSSYLYRNRSISICNSGDKNGRAKIVYQYDINDVLIRSFTTMKSALEFVNCTNDISKTSFYRYIKNNKTIDGVYYSFVKL